MCKLWLLVVGLWVLAAGELVSLSNFFHIVKNAKEEIPRSVGRSKKCWVGQEVLGVACVCLTVITHTYISGHCFEGNQMTSPPGKGDRCISPGKGGWARCIFSPPFLPGFCKSTLCIQYQ